VAEPTETLQSIIRQTAAYLDILREGRISYVEGSFEPPLKPSHPKPAGAKRPPSARTRRPAPLSPEEREALKAAMVDPYAHLATQTRAKPAPRRTTPSQAGRTEVKKGKPKIVLHNIVEGHRLIAEAKTLDELRDLVAGCRMCGLAAARTQPVFGEGNPRADLVFVGEAPGYHEDIQGRPFVGRAGALLTDMIRAMGLSREDVFICNIIKCRPPGNRDPRPDEMKACEPFLLRQLEMIRPKVICALGRYAIQSLLRDTTPVSKLRGKWRKYHNIPLMPTFHPAYLLRNDKQKRFAWEDLKAIMAKMEELKNSGKKE